jgi:hypothetical protein
MQVVRLFDETKLLGDLQNRTINLIHATTVIAAIKKLITAHEIITLNLDIQKTFEFNESIWDFAALKDLNHTRIELLLFHRVNFKPISLVDQYSSKMVSLLKIIRLKNNSFDLNLD